MPKIWTNSGDSHFLEPADLWESRLPKRLADLTPKAEKDPDGEYETVRVDGQVFRRKLPTSAAVKFLEDTRKAVGIRDARLRLRDLDQEGVWGEVIFPSLGMWASTFRTPELLKACMRASNEWALEEVAAVSDRYVVTAQVSTLEVADAVSELLSTWDRNQVLQRMEDNRVLHLANAHVQWTIARDLREQVADRDRRLTRQDELLTRMLHSRTFTAAELYLRVRQRVPAFSRRRIRQVIG